MLSSRLNAFVIPTSHTTAIGTAIQSFFDQLDREPVREDDCDGSELRGELGERGQRERVVEQPDGEEQPCRADDREERVARVDGAHRDREPDAGEDSRKDADPPERGGFAPVPALAGGLRRQTCGQRRPQRDPDDGRCDRKRDR